MVLPPYSSTTGSFKLPIFFPETDSPRVLGSGVEALPVEPTKHAGWQRCHWTLDGLTPVFLLAMVFPL